MLIETKCITEFAKLYGTTWLVNAIVISSILIMAFISNLIVMKKIKINLYFNYLLLFFSILIFSGLKATETEVFKSLLLSIFIFISPSFNS